MLSPKEQRLISKTADAMKQVRNGDPLKDFMDRDEIEAALKLLVKIGSKL